MRAKNNTVFEIVARYVRNRHRYEFLVRNPNIPEEILAVVYFRRQTGGKWWYAPPGHLDLNGARPRWVLSASDDAKWYEIPVCREKIKKITSDTQDRYRQILNQALVEYDIYFHKRQRKISDYID